MMKCSKCRVRSSTHHLREGNPILNPDRSEEKEISGNAVIGSILFVMKKTLQPIVIIFTIIQSATGYATDRKSGNIPVCIGLLQRVFIPLIGVKGGVLKSLMGLWINSFGVDLETL